MASEDWQQVEAAMDPGRDSVQRRSCGDTIVPVVGSVNNSNDGRNGRIEETWLGAQQQSDTIILAEGGSQRDRQGWAMRRGASDRRII